VPVRPASTTTRVMVFNYISQISTFQGDPIPNDLVVTVDSAMHHEAETLLFGSRAYALASHSTVKKAEISEKVLSKISTDFPVMSVPTLPPKPRHNP